YDDKIFQTTLYDFSLDHPKILKEFVFTTSGTFPFSELLERVLTRAKISRVLKTMNPDFEQIGLAPGTNEYIKENIEPKFDSDDYKLLKEIGATLRDKMQSVGNH
ncbi:MAG: hypothetical protein KAJ19_10980, partial [Gammaproteobacteria bacterium]|nr:hypothetical protein [Gammaproteobacteria bacterium]